MILLDDTDKLLEIVLAGAHATTAPPFTSSYTDINQSTFAVSAMGELDGVANGATDVTVVAAPGATTTRKVQHLSVYNVDTAAVVLTVQLDHGGTNRIVWKGTLAVGDTLIYVDTLGFKVTDANGQVKTGPTTVSLTSGITGILPAANGGTGVSNAAGSTITLGGSLTFSGAFTTAITISDNTAVTLPTSGTLVNTAVTTLSSLVSVGTITTGVWNAGAVTSSSTVVAGTTLRVGTAGGTPAAAANVATFWGANLGYGDGYSNVHIFSNDTQAADKGGSLAFGGNYATTTGSVTFASISGRKVNSTTEETGGYLTFGTRTNGGAITERLKIDSVGMVTITALASGNLTSASGVITSSSDERMKDIQGPMEYGLAEVLRLQPIRFRWNNGSGIPTAPEYGGFGAAQVEGVMPLAVAYGPDGMRGLSDRVILGALVNAIKELNGRIP